MSDTSVARATYPAACAPACSSIHNATPKLDIPKQTDTVTYLDSIPTAELIVNKPVDEQQTRKVISAVNTLSADNPSVSFELTSPLARALYQELAAKGYSVTCYSKWDCINTHCTECHKVTVSLPSVSTFGAWPLLSTWARLKSLAPFSF